MEKLDPIIRNLYSLEFLEYLCLQWNLRLETWTDFLEIFSVGSYFTILGAVWLGHCQTKPLEKIEMCLFATQSNYLY